MPAERVTDGGKAARGVHKGQGFEEIEPAEVVPNGFHGAAGHLECFQVRLVVGEERVARGEGDEAALGEFGGVLTVRLATEADDDLVADRVFRGVQAEDGGRLGSLQGGLRDAEVGGHASAGLGGVGDQAANVAAAVDFLQRLRIEGAPHPGAGQGAGDLLEASQRGFATGFPFLGGLGDLGGAVGRWVFEQVRTAEAAQGREFVTEEQAGQGEGKKEAAHEDHTPLRGGL